MAASCPSSSVSTTRLGIVEKTWRFGPSPPRSRPRRRRRRRARRPARCGVGRRRIRRPRRPFGPRRPRRRSSCSGSVTSSLAMSGLPRTVRNELTKRNTTRSAAVGFGLHLAAEDVEIVAELAGDHRLRRAFFDANLRYSVTQDTRQVWRPLPSTRAASPTRQNTSRAASSNDLRWGRPGPRRPGRSGAGQRQCNRDVSIGAGPIVSNARVSNARVSNAWVSNARVSNVRRSSVLCGPSQAMLPKLS